MKRGTRPIENQMRRTIDWIQKLFILAQCKTIGDNLNQKHAFLFSLNQQLILTTMKKKNHAENEESNWNDFHGYWLRYLNSISVRRPVPGASDFSLWVTISVSGRSVATKTETRYKIFIIVFELGIYIFRAWLIYIYYIFFMCWV